MDYAIEKTQFHSQRPIVNVNPFPITASHCLRSSILFQGSNVDDEQMEDYYERLIELSTGAVYLAPTRKVSESYIVAFDESKVFQGRFSVLESKFARELKRTNTVDKDFIRVAFNNAAMQLCKLDFKSTDVEITPNNAVKFIFKFSNDSLLMVSKYIFPSEEDFDKIVFSFFIKGELILSDVSNVSEFTEGIKQHLSV